MQQAQDFLEESEALHAIVVQLTDGQLDQRTGFKNWTINHVLQHLHVWNQAADLSLRDGKAFMEFFQKVVSSGLQLRDFEHQFLDGLTGAELVRAWRETYLGVAKRFSEVDPSLRLKWAGPDMSARSSITARLMETWAHGQEVYDVLGLVRENKDRIRNIVVLGVNTYGWTFKNRGMEPPGPMPHLRLTAPSGDIWTFGDESSDERIEGLAEQFCNVVTQTRNVVDTALQVTGPISSQWMELAQCFAGGAEEPPVPGTRKRGEASARL